MPADPNALESRLAQLLEKKPDFLEGPDAQRWEVRIEESGFEAENFPDGALVFANNGVGDNLFLSPRAAGVMVFRHEGAEIEEYCSTVAELLPDYRRPPSDHPPIKYRNLDQQVQLGDRVMVPYRLWFKARGRVVYVPGLSDRKPSMERDGLAWVGIELDEGGRAEIIVMPDGALRGKVVPLEEGSDAKATT